VTVKDNMALLLSDLIYTSDTHQYRLPIPHGRVPGFTETIDAMGMVPEFSKGFERAKDFGHNVHKLIELDCKGELDESTLSDGLLNPWAGYKKFREDFYNLVPITEFVERPIFHPVYLYGCTPDLPMVSKNGKDYYIFECKTTTAKYSHTWEMQTAAQVEPLKIWLNKVHIRFQRRVLWLTDKEPKYEVIKLEETGAFSAFVGCLQAYKWKIKHCGLYKDINKIVEAEIWD
jgi:hypothetical protein